jgi:endonuclease III
VSAQLLWTRLKKRYPVGKPFLCFDNPLESVVATILSAQCTDDQVNKVTPALFKKYKSCGAFLKVPAGELEADIKSTGFFHNKAKNIRGMCSAVLDRFGGKIPDTMEGLLSLPGVGRKTANVVLSQAFGKVEGVVVDTHVARLSGRLGFSKESDPVKIEQDLMRLFPKKDWYALSMVLIHHGRALCVARKPRCPECFLGDFCPHPDKTIP